MRTIIRGGTLIDGNGGPPATGMAIAIHGDTIETVGPEAEIATAEAKRTATVIDAKGKWVLPGLINMHDHLVMGHLIGNPEAIILEQTPIKMTVNAVRNSLNALRHGWTTMREMGGPHRIPLEIRNDIEMGDLPGPRLISCGAPLCVTGGHAWPICVEIDGPDAARRAARDQLKSGVDFVKVMASHDPLPEMPGPEKTRPEMGRDEIQAAFDEARAFGKGTGCHVMGTVAIERVLDAGVDVISHGFYLNDDLAQRMVEQGVYFDPTLSSYGRQTMNPKLRRGEKWAARHMHLLKPMEDAFRAAVRAGVTIVTGTDTAGLYAEDVQMMRDFGLGAMDTVLACTKNAAAALHLGDKLGTIEAGKLADLVVLDGDPLADAYNLDKVSTVIKAGVLYPPADVTLRAPV